MHQQEVVAVVLQSEVVRDAGCHRYGTHTSITNQRVQLLVLGQEDIHQLDEQDTTHRGNDEGSGTNGEDVDGIDGQEFRSLSRTAYRQT